MSPSMTIPKESSRSKTGQKLCQVVTQAKRKSKKDIFLQGDSAEQLKTINKSLLEKLTIFSEKEKKSEDEIIGDMVASELKDLFCSILKVNFKQKVNNLIFKYQPLNVQQNAQLYSPIQPPSGIFYLTTSTSQCNGAVFMLNTNGSMINNQWNS